MIKCLCKENVQDKFTGENYVAGKEYSFTKERAAEVTKSKYFEYAKVEEPKEPVSVYGAGGSKVTIGHNEIKLEAEEIVVEKPKRVKKSTKK